MSHSNLFHQDSQLDDNFPTYPKSICSTWNIRFFGLFLVSLLFVACNGSKSSKPLVVGMDLSYPPFETIDTVGQPQGVSVDLAKALADFCHRRLKIENIPFTGLIPSLNNGRIDCVISSMTETEERRISVAFSDPYLTIGLALLVGKGSDIQNREDLDEPGRIVAVRQGTTGEVWARKTLKQAGILSLEKENAAVLEVIQGKADAFVYDQMSIWQNAQRHPETTRALLEPLREETWAIAVKLDNEVLRLQINAFLKAYRAEGGFEVLGETYLKAQKEAFAKEGRPFYF
jgi:polar amino acid transport system substrate-binding protein